MSSEKNRIAQALVRIMHYGGFDGAHHKQWVLDQVARDLLGNEYEDWVARYEEADPETGEKKYEWDVGIPP